MPIIQYLLLLLPQLILAITGVVCLILEMFHKPKLGLIAALIGYTAAVIKAISMLGTNDTVFMGTYRINDLSLWANIVLITATAACLLLWRERWRGDAREGTGYALFSFATLGAIILAGAGDLMVIVLGVLLTSVASFALVGFSQSRRSTEAALKYFIYGSVSGAIMLFGFTYWYGIAGSTLISELPKLGAAPLLSLIGLIGVVIGLGYQAAIVPVQQWAPDTYEGASLPVTAYLSVVIKIGAVFALAQLVTYLPENLAWRPIIGAVAAVTILVGTLAMLPQRNIVRLLAYSSIAQTGYFLLAVTVIGRDAPAIHALIVFAAAYAAMNIGAFAVVIRQGTLISDFSGALFTAKSRSIAMIVFLLSLVGIPPLAGFIGKLLLLGSAINGGYIWLAVIAIVGSVIGLGAYLRIIAPMFQTVPAKPGVSHPQKLVSFVVIAAVTLTIGLGIGGQIFF